MENARTERLQKIANQMRLEVVRMVPVSYTHLSLPVYLCRFAVRVPQISTELFSPAAKYASLLYFSPFRPGLPTPGSYPLTVSLCLNPPAATESLPYVHRLRLSASP